MATEVLADAQDHQGATLRSQPLEVVHQLILVDSDRIAQRRVASNLQLDRQAVDFEQCRKGLELEPETADHAIAWAPRAGSSMTFIVPGLAVPAESAFAPVRRSPRWRADGRSSTPHAATVVR